MFFEIAIPPKSDYLPSRLKFSPYGHKLSLEIILFAKGEHFRKICKKINEFHYIFTYDSVYLDLYPKGDFWASKVNIDS